MQPSDTVVPQPVRCAIYTRKSTEDGLEQDFNSLDAQRECAEAYILSQRQERWTALPEHFDDGGFTGANTERPALQRLLAEVEGGGVDCVVVYKVDRLSRSLLDFARIMEVLDKRGVSFVSVTQHLNTNSPMGRLTLNVLLSFAEFEREIISERTRDKMSAARRKGKWTGGCPALGYDADAGSRRLAVNDAEAKIVRDIFGIFLGTGSLAETLEEIGRRGWKTKSWTTRKSKQRPGASFDRPALLRLLTNVLYVGEVRHGGQLYPGEQPGIVDREVWTQANELLKDRRRGPSVRARMRHGAVLEGLLVCAVCGKSMAHGYTTKRGRRYRYYLCQKARKVGSKACPGQLIAARRIEQAIASALYETATQHLELGSVLPGDRATWEAAGRARQRAALETLVEQIRYDHSTERAFMRLSSSQEVQVGIRKSSFDRKRLLSPGESGAPELPRISRIMALAIRFEKLLRDGVVSNYVGLAGHAGVSTVRISQIMKLRSLAPSIQERVLFLAGDGNLSEAGLRDIAEEIDWRRQVEMFDQLRTRCGQA